MEPGSEGSPDMESATSAERQDTDTRGGFAERVARFQRDGQRPRSQEIKRAAKRVDVSNLNLYYGSFMAVEGVDISIEPNKVTALIGSSGCGKSTFLRSLNRMHELVPNARVQGEV